MNLVRTIRTHKFNRIYAQITFLARDLYLIDSSNYCIVDAAK